MVLVFENEARQRIVTESPQKTWFKVNWLWNSRRRVSFIKCPRDEEMQDAEMPEAEDVADAVQAALVFMFISQFTSGFIHCNNWWSIGLQVSRMMDIDE